MLKVEGISGSYGQIRGLNDVSIQVKAQEVLAVIGNIGAGKSTLLKCISGLVACQQGRILFRKKDITNTPAHEIARLGISQVPERRRLFELFTVMENLKAGGYPLLSKGKKNQFDRAIKFSFQLFPILMSRKDQVANTLSGGEQMMLAIARALAAQPALLLLDEPTLGLAPLIVKEIHNAIKLLNKQGMTILLCEQNASFALGVANRGYVLELGKVAMEGSAPELSSSQGLRKVYFGVRE